MQKTVVTKIDDLTGKEFEKGETISFAFEGKVYEIDLNSFNARNFRRSMEKYTRKGRTVHKTSRKVSPARRPEEVATVRQWAKENGIEVADRGRVPMAVWHAYRKVNG
jgi:hypothetical protein